MLEYVPGTEVLLSRVLLLPSCKHFFTKQPQARI